MTSFIQSPTVPFIKSLKFLADQEFFAYEHFRITALKEFLISKMCYEQQNATLIHPFIAGKTGEDYLFNDIPLTDKQLKYLEHFYHLYKNSGSPLKLDLHPGNFVWSEAEEKWYFIDTGTIPQIGSDYYDYPNFKDYFINIWQKRRENMQNIPIRSLDYCIDLNII